MHPSIQNVAAALAAAGMQAAAAGIRVLPDEVRTAAQAAVAVGVDVGAIANSLVFRASFEDGDRPLLALTSGAHRADTAALATLAGASAVGRADPSFVKAHTGQVIGGVAPVGHPRPLTTFVDTALRDHEVVWAAAGHARALFPTTFDELVRLTAGRAAGFGARA